MTRVADLTVEELVSIIRSAVREAVQTASVENGTHTLPVQPEAEAYWVQVDDTLPPYTPAKNPQGLRDLPPIHLGPMREGVQLISREEFYGDDGR